MEDTAIVIDEAAILTNPGAISRRPEVAAVAEVLGKFRKAAVMRDHSPEPVSSAGGSD